MNSDNPWKYLPGKRPFVLQSDLESVEQFNQKLSDFNDIARGEKIRIHIHLLPEPFLGRPDAPVVALNLNPGICEDVEVSQEVGHYAEKCRRNLIHDYLEYPFYYLDPALGLHPGFTWWKPKLRWLVEQTSRELVANRLLCIEYFPYHSKRFSRSSPTVQSQEYTFNLVRSAIKRDALIVLMRSQQIWFKAVPELKEYKNLLKIKSVQNPCFSPQNFENGHFQQIVSRLNGERN